MAYTFLTQQQELAAQVGLDQGKTSDATLFKRWLNNSMHIILDAAPWPFNRVSTPLIIQTVIDITTGTVSVSAGATSVTLSSAPSASVKGSYIQFKTSEDWYEITAHTAGETGLTINPGAISAESSTAYTIRKLYYSTSSAVDRILEIRQMITPLQLVEMTNTELHLFNADNDTTGDPKIFAMAGVDSSSVLQFLLWPHPDAVINLYIDYFKIATDLSTDSSTSLIPEKYVRSVNMEGALWQGYKFIGDNREVEAKRNFFSGIEFMKQEISVSHSLHRVRRAIDNKMERPLFQVPKNITEA